MTFKELTARRSWLAIGAIMPITLASSIPIAFCKEDPLKGRVESVPRAVPSTAQPRERCPQFSSGRRTGELEDKRLDEASGLIASRRNPGVLWSHNDSGGRATLFALSYSGRALGTYSLEGADAVDWEDMAVGPAPETGQWHLYVGDIGTNTGAREKVVVYRVVEPEVSPDQKAKKRKLPDVTVFRLRYPRGRRAPDAEALMVDPATLDLYLVTKVAYGQPCVYRAKAPLDAAETVLQPITCLDLPGVADLSSGLITGGDISADGRWILIRTYFSAYLWHRPRGQSAAQTFEREPCRVPLQPESQGEAIAWSPSGGGYFTVSEGRRKPIYYFERLR